jgi:hypothetical protein
VRVACGTSASDLTLRLKTHQFRKIVDIVTGSELARRNADIEMLVRHGHETNQSDRIPVLESLKLFGARQGARRLFNEFGKLI